jgi:N-acetylglucosaminyl-diphospho-decaprenol L-rhamnosyltransferase
MSDGRIAVVLIALDGGEDIVSCLRSVVSESPAEIVVVDNASTDGSADRIASAFPSVRLVRNARNVGFGPAVNQGVRAAASPYVFIVNQDATVKAGSLAALEAALDAHPKAAAVGALVRNPDGTVQPTKRTFPSFGQAVLHGIVGIFRPSNPGTRGYVHAYDDVTSDRTVDWVSGPAMALRREAFDAVGGFDEAFFFFVEDVDLCRRFRDAGWEVWFVPGAEVTHAWGGSWTRRPLKFMWMHQRNLFRYVTKHYRGAWVLAYPFIAAGLVLRFMLLALRWLITKRSVPEHRSTAGGAGGVPRQKGDP